MHGKQEKRTGTRTRFDVAATSWKFMCNTSGRGRRAPQREEATYIQYFLATHTWLKSMQNYLFNLPSLQWYFDKCLPISLRPVTRYLLPREELAHMLFSGFRSRGFRLKRCSFIWTPRLLCWTLCSVPERITVIENVLGPLLCVAHPIRRQATKKNSKRNEKHENT